MVKFKGFNKKQNYNSSDRTNLLRLNTILCPEFEEPEPHICPEPEPESQPELEPEPEPESEPVSPDNIIFSLNGTNVDVLIPQIVLDTYPYLHDMRIYWEDQDISNVQPYVDSITTNYFDNISGLLLPIQNYIYFSQNINGQKPASLSIPNILQNWNNNIPVPRNIVMVFSDNIGSTGVTLNFNEYSMNSFPVSVIWWSYSDGNINITKINIR